MSIAIQYFRTILFAKLFAFPGAYQMANMTQLEMFKATVAHNRHEGVLYYANFIKDVENTVREYFGIDNDTSLEEYFGMFRKNMVLMNPPSVYEPYDYSGYYEDVEKPQGSYIDKNGTLHIPGSSYHFTHFISPLRNAEKFEQIEQYHYPSVEGFSEDGMAAEVELIHSRGEVARSRIGHMYEDSWQIRGYEQFLMDMLSNPEWAEFILDRITERNIANSRAAARAGVDLLITGDDVANQRTLMFKVDHWRHFIKSRWAKVYAAAREIKPDIEIWYHSDGNIIDIIDELIEIGVTILNPIQPECMNVDEVKKRFGDRVVLDGTIGTQTTMPFGSADDVRKTISENTAKLNTDGGLIVSPTHVLEPEVPMENIKAFFDTLRELNE